MLTFSISRDQACDFTFEEENSIEGMKKLIVYEVSDFRAHVRSQSRAAQAKRQDLYVIEAPSMIWDA